MKSLYIYSGLAITALFLQTSCKKAGCTDASAINYQKEAKKDDGSCKYATVEEAAYTTPSTYSFLDANGNSTVSYDGQTERLNQLEELITLVKTGSTTTLNAQVLKDMFANVGGNGNGYFSFTSSKQLKDKCFVLDQALIESYLDAAALASQSNGVQAADGQAGVLTTGSSTYFFDENGYDMKELIEKTIMGGVFMYQALDVYLGDAKMSVDNTTAVDPANGSYYTAMQHHWDESFGYLGVPVDFPSTLSNRFWGKYVNSQNATLNSNADLMNNYLKGRAALGAGVYTDRDAAIHAIRKEWEEVSAYQAMSYINSAIGHFGSDDAKYLHALTEAYGFAWNLRYAPESTRRMSATEHTALMAMFNTNLWQMTVADLNAIKTAIDAKY